MQIISSFRAMEEAGHSPISRKNFSRKFFKVLPKYAQDSNGPETLAYVGGMYDRPVNMFFTRVEHV